MTRKFLIAVTSHDHYTGSNVPTGLWLSEFVHFWDVLEAHGYEMEITSPKGGKIPVEPKSLKGIFFDQATRRRYDDQAFMAKLEQTLPSKAVNWKDYAGIFYTGGHGVMWDFPDDPALQEISRQLFEHQRIVSSVCHGYCGLLNIRLSSGEYLIQGKRITGYSWVEEILAMVAKRVPYNAEEEAKKRGALYRKGLIPFMPQIETDGLLVTGQNPASTHQVAEKVIELLEEM